jgi:hypothetical protein
LSNSTINTTMSTIPSNNPWFIDSTYFNHMTDDSSIFPFKSIVFGSPTVYTIDGSHLDVSHIGFCIYLTIIYI